MRLHYTSSKIIVSNNQLYASFFPKYFINFFLWLKQKINFALGRVLPEPQLSLIKSLLFGGKDNLPRDLKDKIRRVGLSHLVAVSGLHLTIVSQIITTILNACLISGFLNFFISCCFIFGFVVMADFSSSIIRASIMAFLLLLSQLFHRQYRSSYALIFAILIMAAINPQIIKNDLGFQLSVLATLGIIYIFPLFKKKRALNVWQESFFLSLSALIFVLPWIIYKTQMLSWITPLSNILVVPIIPYIMILCFLVVFSGFIFPISFFLGFCLNLVLTYVLKVIVILSRWPRVEIFIPQFSWLCVVIYYSLLMYFIYYHYKKYEN
ncbi:MAG: ComEC/Rec2 family competence protein [Parcubacteria group bacterium]|nr:ComEC/Rec2 family competence protein [Parcubacteria group bacterium]